MIREMIDLNPELIDLNAILNDNSKVPEGFHKVPNRLVWVRIQMSEASERLNLFPGRINEGSERPGQLIHTDKYGFLVIPEEDEAGVVVSRINNCCFTGHNERNKYLF